MPSNKILSAEDEQLLETGGDVKADTKRRRKKALEDFEKFLAGKTVSLSDVGCGMVAFLLSAAIELCHTFSTMATNTTGIHWYVLR